jgi:hypothetical protein
MTEQNTIPEILQDITDNVIEIGYLLSQLWDDVFPDDSKPLFEKLIEAEEKANLYNRVKSELKQRIDIIDQAIDLLKRKMSYGFTKEDLALSNEKMIKLAGNCYEVNRRFYSLGSDEYDDDIKNLHNSFLEKKVELNELIDEYNERHKAKLMLMSVGLDIWKETHKKAFKEAYNEIFNNEKTK